LAFRSRHGETLRLEPGPDAVPAYGEPVADGADTKTILAQLRAANGRVAFGRRLLENHGGSLAGRVLNVGANLGHEAMCLAGHGAREVVGTDFDDRYRAGDAGGAAGEGGPSTEPTRTVFRAHVQTLGFPPVASDVPVEFVTDDLCATALPPSSFDAIVSWQTLEHLPDLDRAFAAVRTLLVPGGMSYHEYHAFFGIDGGHAACTTRIPWGHARLDREDLAEYFRRHDPDRSDAALDFYDHALNRQPQAAVRGAIEGAGLELVLFVPRTRTEDVGLLTESIMAQTRRIEPLVTPIDLVSRMVRLVVRRRP